jgi:hypothetical protein
MAALITEMHSEYGFRPEAYRFAGVTDETLFAAGVLARLPKKRGPRPRASAQGARASRPRRGSRS